MYVLGCNLGDIVCWLLQVITAKLTLLDDFYLGNMRTNSFSTAVGSVLALAFRAGAIAAPDK